MKKLNSKYVRVGDSHIDSVSQVCNIGAIFDESLRMEAQVAATCKAAWCRLYQISKICPYLPVNETRPIVHAYVTFKLDQNNALLAGCTDSLIKKLQKVQNAAVRLIFQLKKYDHISEYRKELHWLPISHIITFKVLLFSFTFNALHNQGPLYLKDLLH